eukprot:IDg2203t1
MRSEVELPSTNSIAGTALQDFSGYLGCACHIGSKCRISPSDILHSTSSNWFTVHLKSANSMAQIRAALPGRFVVKSCYRKVTGLASTTNTTATAPIAERAEAITFGKCAIARFYIRYALYQRVPFEDFAKVGDNGRGKNANLDMVHIDELIAECVRRSMVKGLAPPLDCNLYPRFSRIVSDVKIVALDRSRAGIFLQPLDESWYAYVSVPVIGFWGTVYNYTAQSVNHRCKRCIDSSYHGVQQLSHY